MQPDAGWKHSFVRNDRVRVQSTVIVAPNTGGKWRGGVLVRVEKADMSGLLTAARCFGQADPRSQHWGREGRGSNHEGDGGSGQVRVPHRYCMARWVSHLLGFRFVERPMIGQRGQAESVPSLPVDVFFYEKSHPYSKVSFMPPLDRFGNKPETAT